MQIIKKRSKKPEVHITPDPSSEHPKVYECQMCNCDNFYRSTVGRIDVSIENGVVWYGGEDTEYDGPIECANCNAAVPSSAYYRYEYS